MLELMDNPGHRFWAGLPARITASSAVVTTAYLLVLIVGIAGSQPRRVGDAQEYMAMALNLAGLHPPSVSASDIREIEANFRSMDLLFDAGTRARLHAEGSLFDQVPVQNDVYLRPDGRQDFPHFWFYPALAAPEVEVARLLGINPGYGFAFLNVILLTTAFFMVVRQIPTALALMLFVGPVLWWVDKAHPEAFTFSLLAIALVRLRDRPWWSLLALAAASTQNPPIALALPLFWVVAAAMDRNLLRRRRFWIGSAASIALALVHPLYYLYYQGVLTPQVLNRGAAFHVPTPTEFVAPLVDLNIGLLVNFPGWLPAIIVFAALPLALKSRRDLKHPFVLAAILTGTIFMLSFAQTTNVNSGSQGPTRYALWLIPLAIPGFALAAPHLNRIAKVFAGALAAASIVAAWSVYSPSTSEGSYLQPTPIASFIWDQHPRLDNPLPEIFYERNAHKEGGVEPVAVPTCTKILLVSGRNAPGCPILKTIPAECRTQYCYANRRRDGGYDFLPMGTRSY